MVKTEEPKDRGLAAIKLAREARGRLKFPPLRFWMYVALALAVVTIFHFRRQASQLESAKHALLAKQRILAHEYGAKWDSLREHVEGKTIMLSTTAPDDWVDRDELKAWDFRGRPGIYLRLRLEEGRGVDSIRSAAKNSLRDAFTACLLQVPNESPLTGAECKRTRDCAAGQMCNEHDRCAKPAQPFNMRVAYRGMYVLSDEWIRDVESASNDLRVRLLDEGFEDRAKDDLPIAVDFLNQAEFFLLVLDEPTDPPVAADPKDMSEALQAVPHMARVGLWRLSDGKLLLRLRREASGVRVGTEPVLDAEVKAALDRQTNSCGLALAIRDAL